MSELPEPIAVTAPIACMILRVTSRTQMRERADKCRCGKEAECKVSLQNAQRALHERNMLFASMQYTATAACSVPIDELCDLLCTITDFTEAAVTKRCEAMLDSVQLRVESSNEFWFSSGDFVDSQESVTRMLTSPRSHTGLDDLRDQTHTMITSYLAKQNTKGATPLERFKRLQTLSIFAERALSYVCALRVKKDPVIDSHHPNFVRALDDLFTVFLGSNDE